MQWLVKGSVFSPQCQPQQPHEVQLLSSEDLTFSFLFFFNSSACGNKQTWHLPPSHSSTANQVCFVKNNYTVIFDMAQIEAMRWWWLFFLICKICHKDDLNRQWTVRWGWKTIKEGKDEEKATQYALLGSQCSDIMWQNSICVFQDGQVLLFCDVPVQPKTKCRTHMEVFFLWRGVTQ